MISLLQTQIQISIKSITVYGKLLRIQRGAPTVPSFLKMFYCKNKILVNQHLQP